MGSKFQRKGFLSFLAQVELMDISVAIGSLTENKRAWFLLKKSGLNKFFKPDTVILKEDITRPKPDPEVYFKTAEKMKINPTSQLVFEDSHNGIRAAVEAGSIAIRMPVVFQPTVIQRMRNEGAAMIFENWQNASEVLVDKKEKVSFSVSGRA